MVEKLFSVAEKNTCRFLFIVTSCWWLFLDQLGLKQFGGGFFCPDWMALVREIRHAVQGLKIDRRRCFRRSILRTYPRIGGNN
ncbi:hypothetical protein T12_6858 [Trichinella patagoniensis]|uniref:Uncharacterized protein n=1 Tax=Trichinella patagoniensis TaxID=990121 RepID=A0A0V0ZGS0_9BILA|nr:hypothetical protein T12_6858 [Trichinella patagoniensis]